MAHHGQFQLTVAAVWRATQTQEGEHVVPAPTSLQGEPKVEGLSLRDYHIWLQRWQERRGHRAAACLGFSASLLLTQRGPSPLTSPGAYPPCQPHVGRHWELALSWTDTEQGRQQDRLKGPSTFKTQILATSFVQLSLTSARNGESTPLSPSSLTCCCLAAGGGGCYSHLERRSDLKGLLG